jgi:DNA-directed RNA polymerase subunit RPC12/RpoP
MSDKSTRKKVWYKTITYVVFFVFFLVAGGNFFLPLGGLGVLLWMVLAVTSLFLLISWHANSSVYQCSECGDTFRISFYKIFLSFYRTDREGSKDLRCPQCHNSSKAKGE